MRKRGNFNATHSHSRTPEWPFKRRKTKCHDVFSYFFRSTKKDRFFHFKDLHHTSMRVFVFSQVRSLSARASFTGEECRADGGRCDIKHFLPSGVSFNGEPQSGDKKPIHGICVNCSVFLLVTFSFVIHYTGHKKAANRSVNNCHFYYFFWLLCFQFLKPNIFYLLLPGPRQPYRLLLFKF